MRHLACTLLVLTPQAAKAAAAAAVAAAAAEFVKVASWPILQWWMCLQTLIITGLGLCEAKLCQECINITYCRSRTVPQVKLSLLSLPFCDFMQAGRLIWTSMDRATPSIKR